MKFFSVTLLGLLGLFITTASFHTVPDSGKSHPSIEAEIDRLVRELMADKVPGMTVALSKNGRMVFNKAYGYSNYKTKAPMRPFHRTRIGSVSKVITALGVMKLTEDYRDFDLKDRVYTEEGRLAEPQLVRAITRCVQRYRPIIAMAIDGNGTVHTWYADQKVFTGTAQDLDAQGEGLSFSLPSGKTVNDIRAMAISPISNRVFTWYDDGSLSSGTARDLDKYFYEKNPYTNSDGEKTGFKKADDKVMNQIVGIAMGKNGSQTQTYTWYDDGTVSVGDARNLVKYAAPVSYSTGSGKSRYDIRGMGMTADNHVITWYSDKTYVKGSYTDLDKHFRNPHSYSLPPGNMPGILEQTAWRVKTEVRHLLSHTAGIKGNGTSAAKAMFNLGENQRLTELQVQTYILSTQKLLFDPGSSAEYSNRGLGFCGWVIEKASGDPYGEYVRKKIFRPLGLDGDIVPNDHPKDKYDSDSHGLEGGRIVVHPWETDPTGYARVTAAGGWASSAASLVRLMLATDKLSSHSDILRPETIDQMETRPFSHGHAMGWAWTRHPRGGIKVHHNGSITGGKAYIVKYKSGYRSTEGYDMGNINVAVCANTDKFSMSDLEKLASDIAKVAARHDIPVTYDLLSSLGGIRAGN